MHRMRNSFSHIRFLELFKRFIAQVNEETVSFLMKANLPDQRPEDVHEAKTQRSRQKLSEKKEESRSILSGASSPQGPAREIERTAPIKSQKIANRNDRVSVQYADGSVKKDVKFKTVEQDIAQNKCVMIDE